MWGDGVRLALGTLTAFPTPPPRRVDRDVARTAMVVAPVVALPLATLVGLMSWIGNELSLPSLVTAAIAIGCLALGSRAMHLDGLADIADGLTASYDRERSLEVMKRGNSGPAGAATLVIVLAIQIAALATLLSRPYGPLVAGVLVCCSRAALTLACMRGVPAAREDGLGVTYTQTVPRSIAALVWTLVAGVCIGALWLTGLPWWHGVIAVLLAIATVGILLWKSVARFGGVTGDTFGASIEVALTALFVAASA